MQSESAQREYHICPVSPNHQPRNQADVVNMRQDIGQSQPTQMNTSQTETYNIWQSMNTDRDDQALS